MRKQSDGAYSLQWLHDSHWVASVLTVFMLAVVGVLDHVTGKDVSFTLFYLVPVAASVWFLDRRAGILMCVAAALTGMSVELLDHLPLVGVLWNASIKFGIYLVLCTLLSYVKNHNIAPPIFLGINRMVAVAIGLGCVLAIAGGLVQRQWPGHRLEANQRAAPPQTEIKPKGALAELSAMLDSCMKSSRPVLLGSRDPNGPSCVDIVHTGDIKDAVPNNHGDLNGGPGTTLATIYYFDRQEFKSAGQDFAWHQGRFKTFLENTAAINHMAAESAHQMAERAQQFSELADTWTSLPGDLSSNGFTNRDDWPSYCMAELDKAVAARDLGATQRWAGELAAATFSLDDLHRWLGFLVQNHLTALEFQRNCESVFPNCKWTYGSGIIRSCPAIRSEGIQRRAAYSRRL
jgi:hypothetical protein